MRSLIIGHSFIARYRRHLISIDIQTDQGSFKDFSSSFGLSPNSPVFLQGRGGIGLRDNSTGIEYIRNKVELLQPDVLLVEIGSNDLVDGVTPIHLATLVRNLCNELLQYSTVKFIVLFQVVNRRRTRQLAYPEFHQARLSYNSLIQRFARENDRIYTFRHDRSILVSLKPNQISGDNIHVTTRDGFRLYHLSVRRALVTAQTRLRDSQRRVVSYPWRDSQRH